MRLIRVVKSCINKCVGQKKLKYFVFTSLFTDVTNAITSRPLTYRDSDIHNLDTITPNSFLKIGMIKNYLLVIYRIVILNYLADPVYFPP